MSDWYAVDVIEQAIDDVKDLLLPFELKDWLKMIVVVLFAGSTFIAPANSNIFPTMLSQGMGMDAGHMTATGAATSGGSLSLSSLAVRSPAFIGLFVLFGLALVIGWMFVAATMEFVFISIARDKTVSISQHFTDNTDNGWRLFGFQIVLGLILIALIGIPAALGGIAGFNPVFLVLLALLFLAGLLVFGLVSSLTIDFVTVKMLQEKKELLESWEGFLDTLKAEWLQILIYLLAKLGLGIAAGIIYGIAFGVIAIALAIVGMLLFFIVYPTFQAAQLVGIIIAVPLAFLFVGVFTVVMLGLHVPIASFFRFYSIRVFEKAADVDVIG